MNCYSCEKGPHPGGMDYVQGPAIGICLKCGVAVCNHHGGKAEAKGSYLLCSDCADGATEAEAVRPTRQT